MPGYVFCMWLHSLLQCLGAEDIIYENFELSKFRMPMKQFHLGTVRIRSGWSEGPIRQSGYPRSDDPHIPSRIHLETFPGEN